MFLKMLRVQKRGNVYPYYSLREGMRVNRRRVTQRLVLHLWELNTDHVEAALRDESCLLRTNLTGTDLQKLWQQYIRLTEVEAAFCMLKSELAIWPVWHRIGKRVDAHIMAAFLGYCPCGFCSSTRSEAIRAKFDHLAVPSLVVPN